jgi:hypothetical protein
LEIQSTALTFSYNPGGNSLLLRRSVNPTNCKERVMLLNSADVFTRFPWLKRGYAIHYRDGDPNRCPGCGRQSWLVGRLTAECAFCETALPREHVTGFGFKPRIVTAYTDNQAMPGELYEVA